MFTFRNLSLLCVLLKAASCHFNLNYPTSIGFDEDKEGDGPCGGFDIPSADSAAGDTIQIGGFPLSLSSTHPQSTWLFRASLDRTASNWTNLLPVVQQSGLGYFCPTMLTLPESFVGRTGVIQIMQDASDGILYQCAAVTFTAGTNTSNACANATGTTATITNQQSFDTSSDTSSTATTSTATMTMTMTGSATAAASTGAAVGLVAQQYGAWSMLAVGISGAMAVL